MTTSTSTKSRRDFLAATATITGAAIAAPLVIPRHVLGQAGGAAGANETVNIGLIGLGGRCSDVYPNAFRPAENINVVAVCDAFKPRVDDFIKRHPDDKLVGYDNFREMIEKEKLDGVGVFTATHQRAWIVGHAMLMGMHAYIEKPMCLTIAEGRYLSNLAKKLKRVTQVGTQQRSLPLCKWATKLVQDGAFGKIEYVRAPNFVGPNIWTNQPEQPMPEGGKEGWWDEWTNQAEFRPYHPQLHYGWSNWWDYDAGGLCFGVSGWGTHSYDQINMTLGTSETGPSEIVLEEACEIRPAGRFPNRKVEDDETGSPYYGMAQVTGPRAKMKMRFKNGPELRFELDGDWGPGLGAIFHGDKGKVEINRHKVSSNPKELTAVVPEEAKNARNETIYHVENWRDCIKSGAKCNADVEFGQRSTTLCELVNIVRAVGEVGKPLYWDPVKEQFTNSEKGNTYLARPRRKGYELPTG
ncbi:MAG: Gfo/Idh/MocA family protein [Thermoguttaceae bacterium]